jgi:hypothetical protein
VPRVVKTPSTKNIINTENLDRSKSLDLTFTASSRKHNTTNINPNGTLTIIVANREEQRGRRRRERILTTDGTVPRSVRL